MKTKERHEAMDDLVEAIMRRVAQVATDLGPVKPARLRKIDLLIDAARKVIATTDDVASVDLPGRREFPFLADAGHAVPANDDGSATMTAMLHEVTGLARVLVDTRTREADANVLRNLVQTAQCLPSNPQRAALLHDLMGRVDQAAAALPVPRPRARARRPRRRSARARSTMSLYQWGATTAKHHEALHRVYRR